MGPVGWRAAATLGALATVVTLLPGCGSATSGSPDAEGSATPATAGSVTVAVRLTDSGCDPADFSLAAGSTIFSVTNSGTTKVKEMEIQDQQHHVQGDAEGVEPGKTRTFVVDLKPGTYQVHCPQAATTFGTLTVR